MASSARSLIENQNVEQVTQLRQHAQRSVSKFRCVAIQSIVVHSSIDVVTVQLQFECLRQYVVGTRS